MVGVGQLPRSSTREGTAVKKTYQKSAESASADVVMPEEVTIGLAEIAASAKESLLALAVGTGLQVMEAMFASDVERLCGPKNKHNSERVGYRHGTGDGSVTLGGRRLPVRRPRMCASDGSEELGLPSYALFSSTEVLGRLAMERMLLGALVAPLLGWPGARRREDRRRGRWDEQVGRLAALRRRHRDGPR
jgi:hypothetical protein